MGWRLTKSDNPDNWDVMWLDCTVAPSVFAAMKPYQRVNHFPGMYAIARKSNLCMNLNKMRKLFPDEYDFFPKTWFLPAEYSEFQEEFYQGDSHTYIVKPEASSQGRGIFLIQDIQDMDKIEHYIVQKYVDKPLLIEGLKFDMRIYVLVTGCDPLRLWIHEEGLARFATEEYKKPSGGNLDKICMHLTNYAVNKRNSKFIGNQDAEADDVGHKRSISAVFTYLEEKGYDVESLWNGICDIIIKTLCTIQPSLAHTYRSCQPEDLSNAMCFEILGFDILVDSDLKPWLLEVNHSPAFSTDSPLDKKIKRQVIKEALCMMGLSTKDKKNYEISKRNQIMRRSVYNQSIRERMQEKEIMRENIQSQRDVNEEENCGAYIKIFPDNNDEYYQTFMDYSKQIWEEFTGSKTRIPSLKDEIPRPKSSGGSRRNISSAPQAIKSNDRSLHRQLETPSPKEYLPSKKDIKYVWDKNEGYINSNFAMYLPAKDRKKR